MEEKVKKLYSVQEFSEICSMSLAGIYKSCKDGHITTVKIGRRIFIPAYFIEKLVTNPNETISKPE